MNNYWHFPAIRPAHSHLIYGEVDENGCWICKSHAEDKDGYIRVSDNYEDTGMHRYIFETFYRIKAPDDLDIRHLCGVRKCCYPPHLAIGTKRENSHDKELHGTVVRGEDHPNAKLTTEDVIFIRTDKTLSIKEMAKKYNVSSNTIRSIINGKSWKHLITNAEAPQQATIIPLATDKPSNNERNAEINKTHAKAA